MGLFSKQRPQESEMISIRLFKTQIEILERAAETLALKSRVDVIREALDYYFDHNPELKPLVGEVPVAKGRRRPSDGK